jgi:curli production assembly/transport component CsgG
MGVICGVSRARMALAVASLMVLGGCGTVAREQVSEGMMPPVLNPVSELNQSLRVLPPPKSKAVVAVYNYADQTGQFKPSEGVQNLSKAVTQGATSVIIKALQDTGNGNWFTVVEREKLDNLMRERRIIAEMRKTYLGEEQVNPQALPPLLFAGILLEGGIIGYDSALQTGGLGARLLGIGGHVRYRLDTITVYLRAVSTKTGQVLASVVTHKTIASVGLQGGVFKFIATDKILEAEAGFTKNEPEQLAVQQAIEKAIYGLVIEGAEQGLWSFADAHYQSKAIQDYRMELFSSKEQALARAEAVEKRNAQTQVAAKPAEEAPGGAKAAAFAPPTKPQPQAAASRQPGNEGWAASSTPAAASAKGAQATVAAPGASDSSTAEVVAVLARLKKEEAQAKAASDEKAQ